MASIAEMQHRKLEDYHEEKSWPSKDLYVAETFVLSKDKGTEEKSWPLIELRKSKPYSEFYNSEFEAITHPYSVFETSNQSYSEFYNYFISRISKTKKLTGKVKEDSKETPEEKTPLYTLEGCLEFMPKDSLEQLIEPEDLTILNELKQEAIQEYGVEQGIRIYDELVEPFYLGVIKPIVRDLDEIKDSMQRTISTIDNALEIIDKEHRKTDAMLRGMDDSGMAARKATRESREDSESLRLEFPELPNEFFIMYNEDPEFFSDVIKSTRAGRELIDGMSDKEWKESAQANDREFYKNLAEIRINHKKIDTMLGSHID